MRRVAYRSRLWRSAAILLPLAIALAATWADRARTIAEAELRIGKTAQTLTEHAHKVLDTTDLALARVLDRIGTRSWDEIGRSAELHAFLAEMVGELPQLESLFLVTPDGRIASSSRAFPMPLYDVRGRDYYQVHAGGLRGLYVSAPFKGMMRGTVAFTISRPRAAPGQPFDGLVAVTVSPDYFEEVYRSVLEPGAAATLIRDDGAVLVRYPRSADAPGRLPSTSPLLTALALGTMGGSYEGRSSIDGRTRLAAYRRLGGGSSLVIFYGIDKAAVLAGWQNRAILTLLVGSAMTILLALADRQAGRERQILRDLAAESERRARAEAALQQAQKLEALGRLAGGVAHDFNNLLTVITGNLGMILRGGGADPRTQRRLAGARAAADKAAALTGHLLSFARQQPLKPESLDTTGWLGGFGEMIAHALPGTIAVIVETPVGEPVWPVEADPAQLELALLNLAFNARDAMPGGGRITISVANRTFAADCPAPALADGAVEIALADTGTGMEESVRARALEPFFTTKERGKGTGLGLSQVYGFVQQSGGALNLESAPGAGTTIRLWLPRSRRPPGQASAAGAPVPAAAGAGRCRILVVEDDPLVAEAADDMLQEAGYGVTTVGTAPQALAVLGSPPAFDVVVTDLVMPGGMTGVELAKMLRSKYPRLPVVLVTGYSEAAEQAVGEGFNLIRKPYAAESLVAAIESSRPGAGLSRITPPASSGRSASSPG